MLALTSLIRANFAPETPCGNGLGRGGVATLFIELPQKIDRSYTIEEGPLSYAL
jgi:hypothetical protein